MEDVPTEQAATGLMLKHSHPEGRHPRPMVGAGRISDHQVAALILMLMENLGDTVRVEESEEQLEAQETDSGGKGNTFPDLQMLALSESSSVFRMTLLSNKPGSTLPTTTISLLKPPAMMCLNPSINSPIHLWMITCSPTSSWLTTLLQRRSRSIQFPLL